jgi:hypothetical protein
MKKQNSIYIALVIILTASLACNIGGTAPATESGQTDPVATTVPDQEAVAIDGPPGPETIDLTSPALYIHPNAPAYKFESTIKYTSVVTTGVAKEYSSFMALETQTQPQPAQRLVLDSAGLGETITIGDQLYMVAYGECTALPDAGQQHLSAFLPKLQEEITGQAPRVESGIEVNGFVTDKYELSSENLVTDDELISAFVYVARNGGFITLFELQGQTKAVFRGLETLDPNQFAELNPNQLADFTRADNYILAEDGSLNIAIPAACEDQTGPATEFPVMDGAIGSQIAPERVFYQIEKTAAEVADFYRAEMPNRGWALTEDTIVERVETASGSTGPVVTLVFTKDGKNFLVKVDGGGPVTGVTIKEK